MYCILVAGMPASGKSTIAVRISESLGIPMLSKDSIKEMLFDDLGFHSRAEKVQLGTAAMHILYYAAAQLMKVGKPLILENNFEDASIPGIMALLETHHYTAVTVRLTGDPEVIYRRFAARDLSDTRHRCDVTRSVSKMTEIKGRGGKRWSSTGGLPPGICPTPGTGAMWSTAATRSRREPP